MDAPSGQLACILAADIAGFSAMMEPRRDRRRWRVKAIVGGGVAVKVNHTADYWLKRRATAFFALC